MLLERSYKPGNQSSDISTAIAEYYSTMVSMEAVSTLAEVATQMAKAAHEHALGEANFFQGKFAAAEHHFIKASQFAGEALLVFSARTTQLAASDQISLVSGYADYYEIEAIEARAFALHEMGALEEAVLTHEIEISRTQAATTNPAPDDFLDSFFKGHLWFAKATQMRRKAEIAERNGDQGGAMQLRLEAEYAEQQSIKLNPQWRD